MINTGITDIAAVKMADIIGKTQLPIAITGDVVVLKAGEHIGLNMRKPISELSGYWVGSSIDISQLYQVLIQTLRYVDGQLRIYPSRTIGVGKPVRFNITRDDRALFSVSIDVGNPQIPKRLMCLAGTPILVAQLEDMVVEKLVNISLETIHRNLSDIADLCVLCALPVYRLDIILDIINRNYVTEMGDFREFISNPYEVEYSYGGLRHIINKPDFKYAHRMIYEFIGPILTRNYSLQSVWNGYKWE